MKKEIYTQTINDLKYFKNKMLMHRDRMFYIKDFEIQTEKVKVKTGLFRTKEKEVERHYLTSLDIVTYFDKYKTLGTMQYEDAYSIILFYNIAGLRENWISFKSQLKHFGINIDKIENDERNNRKTNNH